MIEKAVAINILEEISQCLDEENWQARTLSTAKQYKKGLIIATDVELKELIEERKKYDEDSYKAIELSKKINERTQKIYSS